MQSYFMGVVDTQRPNGKWTCIYTAHLTSTDSSKHFTTHTFMHWWQRPPSKGVVTQQGQLVVWYLAQRHFNTLNVGVRDGTTDPLIRGRATATKTRWQNYEGVLALGQVALYRARV